MNTYYDKGFEDVYTSFGYDQEKLAAMFDVPKPPGISRGPNGIPEMKFKPTEVAKPPKPPTPPVPKAVKPQSLKPVNVKNKPFEIKVPNENKYT